MFDCLLWLIVWIPPSHHHLTIVQLPYHREESRPVLKPTDGLYEDSGHLGDSLNLGVMSVLEPITTSLSERLGRARPSTLGEASLVD
jgi:hypothetical protein